MGLKGLIPSRTVIWQESQYPIPSHIFPASRTPHPAKPRLDLNLLSFNSSFPCNLSKAPHGHPLCSIAPPHPLPLPPNPLLLPPHLPRDHRLPKPRICPRCRNGHPRPSSVPVNAFPRLQPGRFVPLPTSYLRLDELRVTGRGGKSLLEQPSAGQVGVFLCGYRV